MKISRLTSQFASVAALAVTLVSASAVCQAQTLSSPADRDAAARSAYARGDSARASTALNEAVRLNPFDPVALNNLAVNYAATGDYQNAVALLERAQRIAPNRSDIVNNLANLKAWMAQDSQFVTGSRGVPQALNFPRAEDTPPELPPLWAGPNATYPQPVAARAPVPAQGYPAAAQPFGYPQAPVYQQPAYPQPGYQQPVYESQPPVYQHPAYQAPAAQGQTAGYAPAQVYSRAPALAVRSERADSASRASSVAPRSPMITERASDYVTPRKKKKRQVLDCPVP